MLGIPCSSAKSERVFSTGSMTVKKRTKRLGTKRIDHLLVIKENAKLVEKFKECNNRKIVIDSNAFEKVVIEVEPSQSQARPRIFLNTLFYIFIRTLASYFVKS